MKTAESRAKDRRNATELAGTAVFLLLFTLTLILNVISVRPSFEHLMDFGSFLAAGRAASQGQNPYTADSPLIMLVTSKTTGETVATPNLNPPISVLLFQPLANLDPLRTANLWRVVSVALFLLGLLLLVLSHPHPDNFKRLLWAVSVAGFWYAISLGQIYTLLFFLIASAWVLTENGHAMAGGMLLGMVIAIKPNLALWVLFLGAAGYWSIFLAAGVTAAALSLLPVLMYGIEIYSQWLANLSSLPFISNLVAGNSSLQSLTAHFGSLTAGRILSILLIFGGLYYSFRKKPSFQDAGALGIVCSLLASPVSWAGYTVLTIPVFLSKPKWNRLEKLAAAILAFPYLLILSVFRESFLHSVLFGWMYGWGLLLILAGRLIPRDEAPAAPSHQPQQDPWNRLP